MFYLHNTLEKLFILSLGIVSIATLKHLLAEFEEYGVLTMTLDVANHLLISLSSIVLEILEGKGGGHGCANTCVSKENDVAYNAVEMSLTSDLGIRGLVETINTNLYLTDIWGELINPFLSPKDAIREHCGF